MKVSPDDFRTLMEGATDDLRDFLHAIPSGGRAFLTLERDALGDLQLAVVKTGQYPLRQLSRAVKMIDCTTPGGA